MSTALPFVMGKNKFAYEGPTNDADEFFFDWATAFDAYDIAGAQGDVTITVPARTGTVALMTVVTAAAPAEPVACGASSEATMVYVDDTDDTSWPVICICANLDGTGYDWRLMSDISGTACPFF